MTTENEAPEETFEEVQPDVSEAVENTAPDHEEDSTPQAKPWAQEVEDEAKFFGWKPPEEWKGDKPPGYIDNPEAYMERVGKSKPFQKAMELAKQAEEAARRTEAALSASHKRELERQEKEYQRQLDSLTARQRRAAEEADTETFDKIERQKRDMVRPTPPQADPGQLQQVAEDHKWVNDPYLKQHGAAIVQAGIKSGQLQTNDVREQVKYAEERLKHLFPGAFQEPPKEEPKPNPPPKTEGGGLASAIKPKTGFDALPASAKAAFKRGVKSGDFEDTKEDREFFYNAYENG